MNEVYEICIVVLGYLGWYVDTGTCVTPELFIMLLLEEPQACILISREPRTIYSV
jgi:hypothetical protein